MSVCVGSCTCLCYIYLLFMQNHLFSCFQLFYYAIHARPVFVYGNSNHTRTPSNAFTHILTHTHTYIHVCDLHANQFSFTFCHSCLHWLNLFIHITANLCTIICTFRRTKNPKTKPWGQPNGMSSLDAAASKNVCITFFILQLEMGAYSIYQDILELVNHDISFISWSCMEPGWYDVDQY